MIGRASGARVLPDESDSEGVAVHDEGLPGPVDYLVVEFPGARLTGAGLSELAGLVDRGVIRILDLQVVRRGADDSLDVVELADLDGDGALDLAVFSGSASGLLDADDAEQAASLIARGDAAAVLVYENAWAGPFVAALRSEGAELIAGGRIPADDLLEAADRTSAGPRG
jgi:hypothetical protein